mgnify:CR=1
MSLWSFSHGFVGGFLIGTSTIPFQKDLIKFFYNAPFFGALFFE